MHKKIEADLISLAHSILKMKNRDDVFALEQKAKQVSEKISMLAFIETYVNTTPSLEVTKEELISKVNIAFEEKFKESVSEIEEVSSETISLEKEKVVVEDLVQEITEQPFDELEDVMFGGIAAVDQGVEDELSIIELTEVNVAVENIEVEEVVEKETESIEVEKLEKIAVESSPIMTLEEELKDTISVDQMATLFDVPAVSLNDKLVSNIQIDLNDRITFVKHLFDNNQEDFNRVISQLNSFKTGQEASQFIDQMVKPDYDWSSQEEIEIRFMETIQRKFA